MCDTAAILDWTEGFKLGKDAYKSFNRVIALAERTAYYW